uniref:Uncharacterized protein n=1 Tax=Hemiselmis tepida TaxID=464990 RepID=A0A7S0YH62_9CRYP
MGQRGKPKKKKKVVVVDKKTPKSETYSVARDKVTGEYVSKKDQRRQGSDDDSDEEVEVAATMKKPLSSFTFGDETAGPDPNMPPKPKAAPRVTWELRRASFWRWLSGVFLNKRSTMVRPKMHIKYDETITALLYWNEESARVPKKIQDKRYKLDAQVKENVAAQLIGGMVKGWLVRSGKDHKFVTESLARHKQQAEERRRRGEYDDNDSYSGSDESYYSGSDSEYLRQRRRRRGMVAGSEGSDEGTPRSSQVESQQDEEQEEEPEPTEEFLLLKRLVDEEILTEWDLSRVVMELGWEGDVWELPEDQHQELMHHPVLKMHIPWLDMGKVEVDARKVIQRLVREGYDHLVEEVAAKHDIDTSLQGGLDSLSKPTVIFLAEEDSILTKFIELEDGGHETAATTSKIARRVRFKLAAKKAARAKAAADAMMEVKVRSVEKESEELKGVLEESEVRLKKLQEEMENMRRRATMERRVMLTTINEEKERLERESTESRKALAARGALARFNSEQRFSLDDSTIDTSLDTSLAPAASPQIRRIGTAPSPQRLQTAGSDGAPVADTRPMWRKPGPRLYTAPPAPAKVDDDLAEQIANDPSRIEANIAAMRSEVEEMQRELVRAKTAERQAKLTPEEREAQKQRQLAAREKRLKTFVSSASQSTAAALGLPTPEADGSSPGKSPDRNLGKDGRHFRGGKGKGKPSWL